MAETAQDREAAGSMISLRRAAGALSSALPGLILQAERIASTVSIGEHGRRRPGIGGAFWQFRHYSHGDAANKIDWRKSAKSERHFVPENEWQSAQSVWLWCDRSSSMNYCSAFASQTKRERALILGLALASLLMRRDERIGLLQQDGRLPASGRAANARLAENMVLGPGGESDLPPLLPLPRYARLVLISDFLSPLETIAALINMYAASGVKGHLLQIMDPAEEDFPFTGRVRFEGMKGEADVTIGRVEDLRGAYHLRLRRHQDGLRAACYAAGWSLANHRTERPPHLALLALHQVLSGSLRVSG